jgi:hypothetical protein
MKSNKIKDVCVYDTNIFALCFKDNFAFYKNRTSFHLGEKEKLDWSSFQSWSYQLANQTKLIKEE